MAEVRRLLPVGTRLTVKEPYYKSFADGSSGIRVDNPADIVFLQDNDQYDKSLSFDVMKERGNAAFRSAKYELAKVLYQKCCLQKPQDVQILSNLAAVHLRLENWLEALKHAQNGLDIDSNHVKCLYRHGIAATNLEQYPRASCDLILAHKLEPSNHDIASCLSRTQELQRQSQGHYDADKLFLNHQHKSPPKLANFTGPLQVTHLPGKGRGTVVTQDVKAGTLLAVCNPLAIARVASSDFGFQIDHVNMSMLPFISMHHRIQEQPGREKDVVGHYDTVYEKDSSQTDLTAKLANMSMKNPDVTQQIYALYDGTQASLDNTPDIRMFTNQNPGNVTAKVCSVREIANVVRHNAFGSGTRPTGADAQAAADILIPDKNQDTRWCGLYPLMSLINHSCCPNSLYFYVKEAAMLRAGCDLKQGDEVTISYLADLDGNASRRQRDLRSGWKFTCSCSRCKLQQELPPDVQNMTDSLQHELDTKSGQPGTIVAEYRQAVSGQRQAGFLTTARKLDKLLMELEGKLTKASLSHVQQHWVMFTVLPAYLCRRQCFEVRGNERLPQLGNQIAAMYEATIPGSISHINEVVRTVERAQYLCSGSSWQREAIKTAQSMLRLRYGLLTEPQMKNALKTALHNNSSKYEKNLVYD